MDRLDRSLRELASYRLRRTTLSVMVQFNQIFAEFGLRRTTFSALRVIADNPGMRQGSLAGALEIERPNLVHIVDELEEAGLVRRSVANDDRRAYALHATPKGVRVTQAAMARAHACDRQLTRGLTPEQLNVLLTALGTIARNSQALRDAEASIPPKS